MNYPTRYISVDFETTGLVSAYDSPTALALVLFEDGEPTGEAFATRIKPSLKTKLSLEAFAVQAGDDALDPDKVADHLRALFPPDAPSMVDAMRIAAEWCASVGASRIANVAQKASFDWAFWDDRMMRCTTAFKTPPLSPVWYCTKTMAGLAWPDARSGQLSLNAVCAALGIAGRTSQAHDAMEDAVLAGRAYWHLRRLLIGEPCEARR